MSRTEAAPRIAILGAGPIGLEAALYAASLRLPFRVYERGQVGENLRQWGHVKMFTPFGMNSTPLGKATLRTDQPRISLPLESDVLTGREHVRAYLEPLAGCSLLAEQVEIQSTVLKIGRKGCLKEELYQDPRRAAQPFRLLVRGEKGKERVEEADVVMDCTGTYGNGRYLGDGGIPAIGELTVRSSIPNGLEDVLGDKASVYADRTTMVVGSGFSAASTVVLLAELAKKHSSTWIVWLTHTSGTQPIKRVLNDPLRERDLLAGRANMLATRGEGHVEFHANSVLESIEQQGKEGYVVRARVGGATRSWEVDRIIANVGNEPDRSIYQELQVRECNATFGCKPLVASTSGSTQSDGGAFSQQAAKYLQHPEPNFFILGVKSYGRSSHFFLREGFEQVRSVFASLLKKPSLDLYQAKK